MPTIDNWRALREALEAGPTEGPFYADGARADLHAVRVKHPTMVGAVFADVGYSGSTKQDTINAEYIAAAHPAAIRSLLDERDRLETSVEVLIVACKLVIEMNQDTARDKYGDPNKCESWACVRTLRAAIDAAMKGKP